MKTLTTFGSRWMVMGTLASFLSPIVGCSENDTVPNPPVEVSFQLLNTAGEPTTSFHEGEDIVFDYRMINKSNQDVFWFKNTKNYETLFTVSRLMPDQNSVVIGTPHDKMIIYSNGLEMMTGSKLEPNAETVIRMTWKGDWLKSIFFNTPLDEPVEGHFLRPFDYHGNQNLPKGNYVVEFQHALKFVDFKDLNVKIQMPFEVL